MLWGANMDATETVVKSNRKGRNDWKKGMKSPNPGGRPKGSGIKLTLPQDIKEAAKDVLQVVITKAKAGDMVAAGLLLSRCLPAVKAQFLAVDFPLDPNLTSAQQATQILDAIASGRISADVGNSLIDAVIKIYSVKQFEMIEDRLTVLEMRSSHD